LFEKKREPTIYILGLQGSGKKTLLNFIRKENSLAENNQGRENIDYRILTGPQSHQLEQLRKAPPPVAVILVVDLSDVI